MPTNHWRRPMSETVGRTATQKTAKSSRPTPRNGSRNVRAMSKYPDSGSGPVASSSSSAIECPLCGALVTHQGPPRSPYTLAGRLMECNSDAGCGPAAFVVVGGGAAQPPAQRLDLPAAGGYREAVRLTDQAILAVDGGRAPVVEPIRLAEALHVEM